YDQFGIRQRTMDPLANVTLYSSDSIGRTLSVVSPKGNLPGGNPSAYTTAYSYDAFGDVLTVTDPLNNVTSYRYDGNRNLVNLTDAANNSTTMYVYDKDDRPIQLQ